MGHTWRDGNLRFRDWSGQQNHVAVFRWLAGQWRLRTRSREIVGSIIPPFGITLSFLLTRHKYTRAEREALKAAFPMGICMITESHSDRRA